MEAMQVGPLCLTLYPDAVSHSAHHLPLILSIPHPPFTALAF